MTESARHLVEDVFGRRPVRQWMLSFPSPLHLLFASKPEALGPVPASCSARSRPGSQIRPGWKGEAARTGAVTLIQRFGSALNLNVHLHMLWLDCVYEANAVRPGKPRLHRARAPSSEQLTHTIPRRVCRHLARRGWLEGEDESAFLSESAARDDGLDAVRMSSITYRIATGIHSQGAKIARTLEDLAIFSHWSKWCDVLGYYSGAIHDFHDIVVLTPRKYDQSTGSSSNAQGLPILSPPIHQLTQKEPTWKSTRMACRCSRSPSSA